MNRHPIYLADYQENLDKNWKPEAGSGVEELGFQLKLKCLEEMIEQELIAQEADRIGIQVSGQELDTELAGLIDLKNPALAKSLSDQGISQEQWKAEVGRDLRIRKTLDTVMLYQVYLPEPELTKYYEQNPKSMFRPERVYARQILLTDQNQVQEVLGLLAAGADFKELARKYSISPEADRGGELGWVEREQLPVFLEQVLFNMAPGTVSKPIQSPFGYHLLMVEVKDQARQLAFEEARDQIRKTLEQEKKEELYRHWIQGLWKKSRIKINYQLL